MSNSVNLSLDVTKTGIQNPMIKVRQGDGGFETLHTTVTSNGEPLDLQGWTITFMGTTAGNHKIVDGNVNIVEAPNGIFDYTPSKAWGMDIGEFKMAYFKFVKGDGSASSANFRVNVIEAVDLTQEEAHNYISVVDTTIAEIRDRLTSSLADVTASVAATSSAASSMAVYVSSTASSAVSEVSSAASSALSVASSAVDKVNGVAAQVNSLSVGGRNLLLDTGRSFTGIGNNSTAGTFDAQGGKYYLAGGKTLSDLYNQYGSSGYLTLSFDWVASGSTISGTFNSEWESAPWVGIGSAGAISVSPTNTSGHYKITVPLNTSGYSTGATNGIRFRQDNLQGNVTISHVKLEAGNIATDWTPAPEDADNTFLKKTNQLPAEARDFNYLATHMQTYQGTWWNGAEPILNCPTVNDWVWSSIEIIAGNSENSGMIITTQLPVNDVYMTSVDRGNIIGWKLIANDANVVHNAGTETIAGDKTLVGNTTLTGIKSSNVKTGSVALNGLTLDFRQTVVGVNVYMHGSFAGTFGTDQSYTTSSSVIPSNIDNPKQTVVLAIVSNGGVSGITNNSPWELEVLLTASGAIQYRAKNLRDNDITARSTSIVGADSAFYTIE